MVTHFCILAWEIPWIEEPRKLQSMGSYRVRHDLMTKQQQQLVVWEIWLSELYRSFKCGHILLCNKKIIFINTTIALIRWSVSIGKLQAHHGRGQFSKIITVTQNLNF